MPMDKPRYPANWREIAREVKDEAGWRCAECGMQCRRPGEPFDTHRRTLTVHHINHTPEDCRRENLVALCSGCHLRADAKFHADHRREKMMEHELRPVQADIDDAYFEYGKKHQEGKTDD